MGSGGFGHSRRLHRRSRPVRVVGRSFAVTILGALALGVLILVAAPAGAQTAPGGPTTTVGPSGPTATPTATPVPGDTGPLPATAGDGIDGMVPAPDLRGSNKPTLFEAYTPGSYTWDNTLGATDVTEKGENAIANAVMWVVVSIGTVTARALQWVFSVDLVGGAASSLPGPIGQLAGVFYYPLLSTVVLLGALWLVWHGLLQRRATTAAGGLAWMVVAIAVAAWFLAAPATIVGEANSVSVQASRSVLSVGGTVDPKAGPADPTTAQATYGGNAGDTELRLAANRFFQTYVYTPWAVGEFGSADAAAQYAPDVLKAKTEGAASLSVKQDPSCPVVTCPPLITGPEPGFRLYQATVQRIGLAPDVNSWFSGHQAGARLGIAILALLVILMAGGLMLAVVGAVLFAQLALLLLVMLAPFAFLAGVNPAWRHVLTRWAELAVGALLKRVLYAGALAVMLVISGVLLAATAPLGWLGAAALQVALVGTAVVYRKRIMRAAGRMTTPSFGAGTAMLGGAALATAGGAGAGLKVASTLYTAKTLSRGARGAAHTARRTAGRVGRLAGTPKSVGGAATAATGIFSGGGTVLTAALVRRVAVPLRRLRNGRTPATQGPSSASHPDRRSYGAPPPRDSNRPLTRTQREERTRRRRDAAEARQADRRRRET